MKNSGATVRNFVSEALSSAFYDNEFTFGELMNENESQICSRLLEMLGIDFTIHVEREFSASGIEDLEPNDLETAFYESDLLQESLADWLKNALYDAKQAAKKAFRDYLFTKVDTQDLANELVSYVERNN